MVLGAGRGPKVACERLPCPRWRFRPASRYAPAPASAARRAGDRRLFAVSITNLYLVAAAAAAYAALEGTEAVGLWLGRRWAEYLTLVATAVFVPYEILELTRSISWLKLLTLVINLLIVIYLLAAKRLLGLRGGGKAERAERAEDSGWAAIERATPGLAMRIAPTPKGPAVSPDKAGSLAPGASCGAPRSAASSAGA